MQFMIGIQWLCKLTFGYPMIRDWFEPYYPTTRLILSRRPSWQELQDALHDPGDEGWQAGLGAAVDHGVTYEFGGQTAQSLMANDDFS